MRQGAALENTDLADNAVNGVNRQFRLFVLSNYHKNNPVSVVLNFHGTSGTPVQQVEISDIETLAEPSINNRLVGENHLRLRLPFV